MLWRFIRFIFWRPSYDVALGTSFISAEEALASAKVKATAMGGDVIGIAADALCCCGTDGTPPSKEYDVYLLVRK